MEYDYDYISFLVSSIYCDYSKNCNRLQSITIDDYDYPMSANPIKTIFGSKLESRDFCKNSG